MNTYDYYGWTVSEEDVLPRNLKNKNIDITNEDIEEMSNIISKHILQKRVAVDAGCHYGFFTRFLSTQFDTVHAFDFDNDIYQCCLLYTSDAADE